MRTIAAACCLAIAAAALAVAQSERTPPRTPKKGDTVVVKGCLHGTALESTETAVVNEASTRFGASALTYRLSGDKGLLKKMREEHDGKVVEITGVLKSNLPPNREIRAGQIGRTRITVGVGSPHIASPADVEATRSIPILEVKSYEGSAALCGG
jgi:hypothetical protein